jgi:hypothetical protein
MSDIHRCSLCCDITDTDPCLRCQTKAIDKGHAMQHTEDLVEQIDANMRTLMRTASKAEEQHDATTLAEIQAVLALAVAALSSRVFLA